MTNRILFAAARLFFAALTLVAVIAQLAVHIQHGFDLLNFFSYFTNLSNIFASVVFIISAVYLLQRREPTTRDEIIRGASVVAMAVVGIVFSVLLQDTDLGLLMPWVNAVVHYIMPIVVVADWLLLPPPNTLTARQALTWLIYPLLYIVYILIRGAIVSFYPYPFLNPAHIGGYGVVALYCVGIFVLFLVFGAILLYAGNRLKRALA